MDIFDVVSRQIFLLQLSQILRHMDRGELVQLNLSKSRNDSAVNNRFVIGVT